LNIFEHPDSLKWEEARTWGLTQAGKLVSRGPALFPRLDLKALDEDSPEVKTAEEDTKEKKEESNLIDIEDFAKIDLRVATVIACEKMKKADKLLVLTLQLGEEQRTVVSGIAKAYEPEQLVGKKVVLVANLKPVKLRGVLSQGMILAASDSQDNDIEVLSVERIASGNRVK
jgi:methionyl-tRNA synthetase